MSLDHAPRPVTGSANVSQQWLFGVLLAVHGAGLACLPFLASGGRLMAGLAVEAVAALGCLAGLAVRLRRSQPLPDEFVLAILLVAAPGTAVRMAAAGTPWAGMDVILTVMGASAIRTERYFWTALAGSALTWLGGASWSISRSGVPRPAWLLSCIVMFAAGGLVAVLRAGMRTLEQTLDELRQNVAEESVRDALTGAVNRRGLEMLGLPLLENARRQGEAVHCMFIDVDGFRALNAAAGFEFADEVLVALTESLKASVRATDSVARCGGDQFVVIGPGTGTSPLELERRIRARLAKLTPAPGVHWQGRVSIGSATLVPWDDGNLDTLLGRAEQDMRLRRSLRRQGAERGAGSPRPGRSAVRYRLEDPEHGGEGEQTGLERRHDEP